MTAEGRIEVKVVDTSNAEVGSVELPEAFGGPVNDYVLFEQVLAQLASRRRGTAATKTRGQVSGGGKKPWRQKGTGRARAGSIRSPLWRGGGTVFGPQPRSYAYRLPRKSRRLALRSALAQKARDGQLVVVDRLEFPEPKTKRMRAVLDALGIDGSVLVVLPQRDVVVEKSGRNLPGVTVTCVAGLNVYDILRHERLLIVRDALGPIEERCAG
ncbi:MAG: 50S ribosomal protein L4 [Candidatus Dadabacteria bacterium]|nr:MAG: 50S ribosomal protein L4 [Candidatus Dadabacteria bacterium]